MVAPARIRREVNFDPNCECPHCKELMQFIDHDSSYDELVQTHRKLITLAMRCQERLEKDPRWRQRMQPCRPGISVRGLVAAAVLSLLLYSAMFYFIVLR